MTRHRWAQVVLLADGTGYAVAGAALGAYRRLLPVDDPLNRFRTPLMVALGATSASLLASSVRARNRDLQRSAAVNALWSGWCAVTFPGCRTRVTRSLVAATGAVDTSIGVAQWALRSRDR